MEKHLLQHQHLSLLMNLFLLLCLRALSPPLPKCFVSLVSDHSSPPKFALHHHTLTSLQSPTVLHPRPLPLRTLTPCQTQNRSPAPSLKTPRYRNLLVNQVGRVEEVITSKRHSGGTRKLMESSRYVCHHCCCLGVTKELRKPCMLSLTNISTLRSVRPRRILISSTW